MVSPLTPLETPALSPLSWNDLLAKVRMMPREDLTEDVLYDMVQRLEIDSGLLAPFIQFSDAGYSRNVLYRDEKFEAICLCWQPGQGTAIHNHGASYGVVYVYEGVLAVANFLRKDDGSVPGRAELHKAVDLLAPAGALMLDRVGSVHRLGNPPQARRRAVSLHFYAGPLDVMEIFDPATDTVTQKPMQGEPMAYIEASADVMAAMI